MQLNITYQIFIISSSGGAQRSLCGQKSGPESFLCPALQYGTKKLGSSSQVFFHLCYQERGPETRIGSQTVPEAELKMQKLRPETFDSAWKICDILVSVHKWLIAIFHPLVLYISKYINSLKAVLHQWGFPQVWLYLFYYSRNPVWPKCVHFHAKILPEFQIFDIIW